MKPSLRAAAVVLIVWGLRAEAQFVDPSLRWRTLDSAHFSVHFAEHTLARARTVAEVAETVYPRVTGWLKWKPESRTQIVVLDSLDSSNGYASPYPFNFIGIVLSPPDEGELLQNREWLEFVLTHEFTHIVHLDQARGPAGVLRRIFGRYLVLPLPFTALFPSGFPNLLEPNWMTEGLAVYSESDWNRGYGRLGQSHFEGMMRAESARGLRSLAEVNAEGRGFPLNRDYLYGGYFFRFLAERYGPEAIPRYVETYSGRWFPFQVHSTPRLVTGKAMDELWLEYHEWLTARFAGKSAEPGREHDEAGEIIVHDWSVTSPLRTRGGDRWYVQGNGYTLPRLMRQTLGGEVEAVRNV
ncbi:MAG: M1 family metallopeptidase, partial [Betaproteobacteria bacterium]